MRKTQGLLRKIGSALLKVLTGLGFASVLGAVMYGIGYAILYFAGLISAYSSGAIVHVASIAFGIAAALIVYGVYWMLYGIGYLVTSHKLRVINPLMGLGTLGLGTIIGHFIIPHDPIWAGCIVGSITIFLACVCIVGLYFLGRFILES